MPRHSPYALLRLNYFCISLRYTLVLLLELLCFHTCSFLWQNCFFYPYYGKTFFDFFNLLVFSLYFVCHVLLSYSVFNEHRLTLVKLYSYIIYP